VREHAGRVRRVLARRGVPASELPDVEQEVFIVAHRKLAAFEGRSSIATWLLGIAANVASQHRRSARYRRERVGVEHEPACEALDPLARLQAGELVARVRRVLDALSAEQRDVIVLHELSELSMHEVARELGVPLKTAFSRLYAGHRALRRALERDVAPCLPAARKPRSRIGALVGLALGLRWLPRAQACAAQLQLAALALVCASLGVPDAARELVLTEISRPPEPAEQLTRRPVLPAIIASAAPHAVAAPLTATRPLKRAAPAERPRLPAAETPRDLVVFRTDEADPYARLPYPHPFEDRAFTSIDPTRIKPRLVNTRVKSRLVHREAFCPAHVPCAL
jgi:RNA polymerase sigma-70 factor (ECF subfamily)